MKPKHWVLPTFAAAAFLSGMANQYFYPGVTTPPSGLVLTLVGAALIFAWYRLDAIERGYRRSLWLDVGVIALSVVALPWYFFRSRGAWRGMLATLVFLLLLFALLYVTIAGEYAMYYGFQA